MPVIGKELRVPKSAQATPPASERTDAELLSAVAAERCRASFTEVVMRYERPAYNIALNITRSAALAEEAAQEAMLRVWLSAQRFDPEGSARGWILGIVAREALKKVRDRRKDAEKVKRAAHLEAATLRRDEPVAEQKELLATLQKGLEELPELNRQLVALYYGAGMSQAQVGQSVDLSQRMVGYKLEETLKLLRSRLAQAGLAAAAPALGSETLSQAVCSGYPPPADLCSSVMARLDSAVAHAAEASARVVAAKGSGALLWAAAAVTVVAAGAGGWYALQEGAPDDATNTPAVAAQEEAPAAAPAKEDKPFRRVWNFNDGPSPDFFAWANLWEWQREKDGVGRMIAKKGEPVNLLIDVRPPKRPFVLHFRAKPYTSGLIRDNFFWATEDTIPGYKVWSLHYGLTEKSTISMYFFGRYVVHRTDGQTWLFHETEEPYPGDRMSAVISNFRVEEIEMRELTEKEIADFAFDPQAEIARMERLKAQVTIYQPLVFRGSRATDAVNDQEFKAGAALSWYWDFKDAIPKDLIWIGGQLEWFPAKGNRKAEVLLPNIENSATKRGFLLPVRVAERPCLVEVWGRVTSGGATGWGINLMDGNTYARARYWPMAKGDPSARTSPWRVRFYLNGTKGLTISDSTILSVNTYAEPTPGTSIAVTGMNYAAQSISLRYIKTEELPEALRDEKAWEAMLTKAVAPSYEVGLPPGEKK